MTVQPDLFAEPADASRHWLGRISDTATMPDWVSAALPDDMPDWCAWLVNAASLSRIYADCALTTLAGGLATRPIADGGAVQRTATNTTGGK